MSGNYGTTFGNSGFQGPQGAQGITPTAPTTSSAKTFTGNLTAGSNNITNISSSDFAFLSALCVVLPNKKIKNKIQINGFFGATYQSAATITDLGPDNASVTISVHDGSGLEVNNLVTATAVKFYIFPEEEAWDAYTEPSQFPSSAGNGNLGAYAISLSSTSNGSKTFVVDTSFEPYRREAFRHKTIPSQRQSIMMTNIAGQGTVNTEGLWRREQTEWTMGAGQQYLDRKSDSQETRFLSSKGVDVFSMPLQATLLPDTYRKDVLSSPNDNLRISRCGDYLVVVNGATVSYVRATRAWNTLTACTFDGTVNKTVAGVNNTTPTAIYSITTNDLYAYIATNQGIWFCQIGTSSVFTLYMANEPAYLNDGTTANPYAGGFDMIRWTNDQLVCSRKNRLYAIQPRTATAFPTFGTVPAIVDTNSVVTQITGDGTNAQVTTQTEHNLAIGQPIAITKNQTHATISSVATTVTFKGRTTNGSPNVTAVTSTVHLAIGQTIAGTYVPSGATITAIGNGTITMSANATGTGTVSITSNFGGVATVTTSKAHNLSAGETITIVGTGTTLDTAVGDKITVASVVDTTSFTFNTASTASATKGEVLGSDGYGFNSTYQVATVIDTKNFTVATPVVGMGTGGQVVNSQVPDMLTTHTNPQWVWSDATGGLTQVYFSGYVLSSNGKKYGGSIYRSNLVGASTSSSNNFTTITNNTVIQPFNLNTPVQALPMSPDEYPTCIKSYLNFIFVGTNRGMRMCQTLSIYDPTATATGDLKSGPLLPNILQPVTLPVTGIIGDGRYVWFTWNHYDSSSTGLGKLDLGNFIAGDLLAPAYASDLMVTYTGQYDVNTGHGMINSLDWDPFDNVPIMAIGGAGIYAPYATNEGGNATVYKYVVEGNITSGIFDYGIPDKKIPIYFSYGAIAPVSGGTSIQALVNIDPNDEDAIGYLALPSYPNGDTSKIEVEVPQYHAEQFQVSVNLLSDYTQTNTPYLHRWTLKSWPAAVSGTQISVVVQLFSVNVVDGLEVFIDPYEAYTWLENRRQSQEIMTYQEGPMSVQCVIDGLDWLPHKRRGNYENGFEGDCVINLKTIAPYNYVPVTTVS